MDSEAARFGVLVLPTEPWVDLVARWRRLEAAGLDSIWSCDHFTHPHRPGTQWFEAWTGLAGLAAATTRVRIGLLVGSIVSRPPTLFANEAKTVDHLSGGRLELGLGAGGAPTDQMMWGVDDWAPRERADRFAEYVEFVDRLCRGDDVNFLGRWYGTSGARMSPGFVQVPRPPLLLAAHGPRTLAVAARFADTWNTFGPTLADAVAKGSILDALCQTLGRDPTTIRRSVLLGLTEDTSWTSPEQFEDLVGEWYGAGFREFIFYDPPYARAGVPSAQAEAAELVLAQSLPKLRSALS